MLWQAVEWAWEKYRPAEGWLSLFLLLAAIGCLTGAVVAVEWVPEGGVVAFTTPLGLLLGVALAKRPLPPHTAWLALLNYGLVATTIYLGQLVPPPLTLFGDGGAYFRQQWAVFFDRVGGWLLAVSSGGRSRETIVFAFGLGLLAWLLGAYAGWSTYRQQRPLTGLTLVGLALAVNGYYGNDETTPWFMALFLGATTLLVATMHFATMEKSWTGSGIDYSSEIRFELLATVAGIAVILLLLAFFLPAIRFSALARAFRGSEPVQQAEDVLDRAFAGVRQPRGNVPVYAVGSAGVMPRSFLIGNAPSLYETMMMTATLSPQSAAATHWRAASYDVYTGHGWALSRERQEALAADEALSAPDIAGQTTFTQTVHWLYDERRIRYLVGFPLDFDDAATLYWRGVADFSRVEGEAPAYHAISHLTTAGPEALREADPAAVPEVIASRYTNLPEGVPERVLTLAREVAADHATAYDQARALEAFLRQYPYTLEVEPPPVDRDPVDFFLFELQRGYCDYYASAMVVMARSLGLPARLATGFLAQPPDENGVQAIYQINAHAWAEIYFAGYGWVEFEPTAPFGTAPEEQSPQVTVDDMAPAPPTPPPIPEVAPPRLSPLWALPLVVLILGAWWWWHHRPVGPPPSDGVLWAYDRLLQAARRLGEPLPPNQTPAEFQASFLARLAGWETHPWLARRLESLRPGVERLTTLFVSRQYSGQATSRQARSEARQTWRQLAGRLRLLHLLARLFRRLPQK